IKFDGKNEKDAVTLNSDEKEYLQDDKEFVGDVETGEVEDVCKTKTTDFESQKVKGTSHTHVSKEVIEKKIEIYKQKLDSLNEQTELMSVSLQSLTNQRKICFETISNIVKKQEDCVGTIVRNIG
ncbi:MAG TPA: hypothetical protein VJC18_04845, partial [bacterium]|nr:hypothetical protein [bacterium]